MDPGLHYTPRMRIAVTGGSGQLGSHVLRRLLDDPRVDSIVSLDLRAPRIAPSPKLRHIEIDVRDPNIGEHLASCDVLVHLAFVVIKKLPREVFDDINVRGSQNVFRAAYRAGVRRFVYTSSVAAYGVVEGHPRPLTEDAPRVRQTDFAYACAKYDVEAFLDAFDREHTDLAVVRLRPGVLIGTRIEHPGASSAMARIVTDMGGGPSPLVWDEDVADAVVLGVTGTARGAFNVVAAEPLAAAELARAAGLRYLPLPSFVLRATAHASAMAERLGLGDAIDPAWLEVKTDMLVSSDKAKRELRWRPNCPTSTAVMRRFDAEAPYRLDPRIALFARIAASPVGDRAARMRIHLALTGRDGGDFTVTSFANGDATITHGIPRPPDAVVTLAARTFVKLFASDRSSPSPLDDAALVRIDGPPAARELVRTLIDRFHLATQRRDPRGWTSRQLARWLARTSG